MQIVQQDEADQQEIARGNGGDALDAIRNIKTTDAASAVEAAAARKLALDTTKPPVFNTHSDAMKRSIYGDMVTLTERRANLVAEIVLKQAEVDDIDNALRIGAGAKNIAEQKSG